MNDIKEALKILPDAPGVYLMHDSKDEIIYVGKAISLRRRVRQYFDNNPNKGAKVEAMVSHIAYFEYIIVDNEVEALILESNLIKENRPKYNILLRDDKQYPYIKITSEKFPRIQKVRRVLEDGARYFGPFPNAYAVNDIIDLLRRIYKIRTCNLDFDKGQTLERPCLNFYIDRCDAPCVGKADEAAYDETIDQIAGFLAGNDEPLKDLLTEKMLAASEQQKYEIAASYRDHLISLAAITEKQKVTKTDLLDRDMIAMARGEKNACVQVFFVRNGAIVDREHFIVQDDYHDPAAEVFGAFLKQFYAESTYIPKEILLDQVPDDLHALEALFKKIRGSKVQVTIPKRGEKRQALDLVRQNAEDQLVQYERKHLKRERSRSQAIQDLEAVLGQGTMRRVECYDISNISGAQSVGAMVVFEDGEKANKEYRKFRIKNVEGPDDYASLREVLIRRFERGLKERQAGRTQTGFGRFPTMIMMDGGKGQVSAAEAALQALYLEIPVCGLVKDDKHRTRGIYYRGEEHRLFSNSPAYRLVFRIQEEAHRFALSYHRSLRSKAMKESVLDEIPGIGPVRKKALLQHFKSIDAIRRAGLEEIKEVDSINHKTALSVYHHFRGGEEDQ